MFRPTDRSVRRRSLVLAALILVLTAPAEARKPQASDLLRDKARADRIAPKPDFVCQVTISDREGAPDTWKKEMLQVKNAYFYVVVQTTNNGGPAASPVSGSYNLTGSNIVPKNVGFTVPVLGAGQSSLQSIKEPFTGNSCQPKVTVLINGGKYVPESNYANDTATWTTSVTKVP